MLSARDVKIKGCEMEQDGQAVSAEKAREIYEDIIGRNNVTYSQFLEDRRGGEVEFIDIIINFKIEEKK